VISASENNPNMRIFVFIGYSVSQDEVHQTALLAFFAAEAATQPLLEVEAPRGRIPELPPCRRS
jgi:hypothetical protein